MKPRILLLSAYDATSHRLWHERLVSLFPEYDWTCLSLPPRHFNWRIRGNSLYWGFNDTASLSAPFDLLIATSMVDLSSLRGFVPALSAVPTLVYFHENQFVYPPGRQRGDNVEPQLVPLYAALCANRIAFNSAFNRHTFLEGAKTLLNRLPDRMPETVMQRLEDSIVLPVPIPDFESTRAADARPPESIATLDLVWNHRWEYDKGTDLLLALVQEVYARQLRVRFHIVGEQFREQPPEFGAMDALLDEHAEALSLTRGHFAHIADTTDYHALLTRCDVVLSTARHDFQGLAIQEACLAGCTPLAPAALVYPEYLDCAHLYPVTNDLATDAGTIADRLALWLEDRNQGIALPRQRLDAYKASAVRGRYAELFESLL